MSINLILSKYSNFPSEVLELIAPLQNNLGDSLVIAGVIGLGLSIVVIGVGLAIKDIRRPNSNPPQVSA